MKVNKMEEVNKFNESSLRQKFCEQTGHVMLCISETIDDMLSLMAKTYMANGWEIDMAIENVIANTSVETFEKHLLSILNQKECNCEHKKYH
jgi:hypothetical protein